MGWQVAAPTFFPVHVDHLDNAQGHLGPKRVCPGRTHRTSLVDLTVQNSHYTSRDSTLFCSVWEMVFATWFLGELWTQAGVKNCSSQPAEHSRFSSCSALASRIKVVGTRKLEAHANACGHQAPTGCSSGYPPALSTASSCIQSTVRECFWVLRTA